MISDINTERMMAECKENAEQMLNEYWFVTNWFWDSFWLIPKANTRAATGKVAKKVIINAHKSLQLNLL